MRVGIQHTLRSAGKTLMSKVAKASVRTGAHRAAQASLPAIALTRPPKTDAVTGEGNRREDIGEQDQGASLRARVAGSADEGTPGASPAPKQKNGGETGGRVTNPIARIYNAIVDATTSQARLEKTGRRAAEALKRANDGTREGQAAKRRAELEAKLPDGVTVGTDGVISGRFSGTTFSTLMGGGKSFEDYVNDIAAGTLEGKLKTENKRNHAASAEAKASLPKEGCGVCVLENADKTKALTVNYQAKSDFYRMTNLHLHRDGREIFDSGSMQDVSIENDRNFIVAEKIYNLCGGEDPAQAETARKGLLVISGIVNQTYGRYATEGIKKDGDDIRFIPVSYTHSRTVDFIGQDGLRQTIDNDAGIFQGRADIRRDGDDIYIRIEQLNYYQETGMPGAQKTALPYMDGCVIKAESVLEYRFSLKDLADGNVHIETLPVVTTFSGAMPTA